MVVRIVGRYVCRYWHVEVTKFVPWSQGSKHKDNGRDLRFYTLGLKFSPSLQLYNKLELVRRIKVSQTNE